jgi:hypothetical protein
MNKPTIISDISSLVDAVVIANKSFASQIWWRGHANSGWDLKPSVFREKHEESYEQNVIFRFRQKAQVRHGNLPSPDDYYGWLFLMQHYRLPTRLLDWTESPLNAAFFALGDKFDEQEDGCLYALNPYELNQKELGVQGTIIPNNVSGLPLIKKAFDSQAIDINKVLAIEPSEVDIRMMVQLSTFTVHGTGKSIYDCAEIDDFLIKFLIPSNSKKLLRDELKYLGIRESNLFPDLEHLAQEIKSVTFRTPLTIDKNTSSTDNEVSQDINIPGVDIKASS